MSTRPEITAQTLAYFPPNEEGKHIEAFPKINAWHCMKWSASDVFKERDDAYRLLAKIALRHVGYGEADEVAREFFDEVGEFPENYYDPDEEEESDEGKEAP